MYGVIQLIEMSLLALMNLLSMSKLYLIILYVAISSNNNRSDRHVISSPDYDPIPNLNISLMSILSKTRDSQHELYSCETTSSRVSLH